MEENERVVIEEWFPSAIFDDFYRLSAMGESSFGTFEVHSLRVLPRLNERKFEMWYLNLPENQRKITQDSIASVHRMVNEGFLFDLFGGCNFTFRNGVFTLIDVEPLQLSNIPNGTQCVSYTMDVLNFLFRTTGLPEIDYAEIVKRHYGDEKYLQLEHAEGTRTTSNLAIVSPSEWWYSNVTNAEELALYRQRLTERQAEQGFLEPPSVFPSELQKGYTELLSLPDEFFAGMIFDWTSHYSSGGPRYLMGG